MIFLTNEDEKIIHSAIHAYIHTIRIEKKERRKIHKNEKRLKREEGSARFQHWKGFLFSRALRATSSMWEEKISRHVVTSAVVGNQSNILNLNLKISQQSVISSNGRTKWTRLYLEIRSLVWIKQVFYLNFLLKSMEKRKQKKRTGES